MSSSDKVVTCNGLSSTRSSPLELEDRNAEAPVQALLAQGFHQGKGRECTASKTGNRKELQYFPTT